MSALRPNGPRRLNHFQDKFRRHFESNTRGMSGHKSSVLSTTKILLSFGLREIVFQRQAAGSQCRKELKVEARQSLINVKSSAVLRQKSAEDHLSRAKVAHHRPHLTKQRWAWIMCLVWGQRLVLMARKCQQQCCSLFWGFVCQTQTFRQVLMVPVTSLVVCYSFSCVAHIERQLIMNRAGSWHVSISTPITGHEWWLVHPLINKRIHESSILSTRLSK